jgi:hypothetical protein
MPSINTVKDSVGIEAVASPGVAVAPAYVLPITGLPGLDTEIGKEKDTAIVGKGMAAGAYKVSEDSKDGSTGLSPRGVPSMAIIMHSLLGGGVRAGQALTGVEIGALIRIRYTGSSESCKFTITSGATPKINSKIGVRGSEANDAAFGTTGDYTVTAIAISAMLTTIDGYADYEAQFVMGDPTIVGANKLLDFGVSGTTAREGKGNWCYIWFAPTTTSGLYKYEIPVVTTNTERPTLTRQIDGRGQSEVWSGFVVEEVGIEASLQAFITATVQGLAMYQYRPKTVQGTLVSGSPNVTMIDTRELKAGMVVTSGSITGGTGTISSIGTIDEYGTLVLSVNATASLRTGLAVDNTAQTGLNLETAKPFVFNEGKTSIDGSIIKFIRSVSLTLKNNHQGDNGYGQGTFARLLHQKGVFEGTGSLQLALDATALGLRNKALDDTRIGLSLEFRGALANSTLFLYEYMLVELPYVQLMNFTRPENNGQVDASAEFSVISPGGTLYNDPTKVTMVVAKSSI